MESNENIILYTKAFQIRYQIIKLHLFAVVDYRSPMAGDNR